MRISKTITTNRIVVGLICLPFVIFSQPCPPTVNFTIASNSVGTCTCNSDNGYLDFSSMAYAGGASPSDTVYNLAWPGQPDVDVLYTSSGSDVYGLDFPTNYTDQLQPEYGQFLGYDNSVGIPYLNVGTPKNETAEVVLDFEYAHQNFDLLIFDIDRHDTLIIEAKDAFGNLITDFSNWTVLSYGDLTAFTLLSPIKGHVWEPTIGRFTYENPIAGTVSFTALRPDIPISEIKLNFEAGLVDANSHGHFGLYGWGACTNTLDVDVAWTGTLPTDAVVRLTDTDTYLPIPPTATSPHSLQFEVLSDGGVHDISITNEVNDCIHTTGDTYTAATSCQEYCSITFDHTLTHATSCSADDGEVIINAAGGSTPYEYSIDAGVTWQSSNTFSNIQGSSEIIISVRNTEGTCHDNRVYIVNSRNTLLQVGDGVIACKPDTTDVTLGIKKVQPIPLLYQTDSLGYDVSRSIPESDVMTTMWTTSDFGGYRVFSHTINPYTMDIYAGTSSLYFMNQPTSPRIYSIDGQTGVSTMLAQLPGNHGLTGIEYDSVHFQIFAGNLEDGKIYRVSGAGTTLSEFDPMTPDDGIPGIVERGERVAGLTVNYDENRLYYAIWANDYSETGNPNTIRSVGLTATGDFIPGTDQLEITLPVLETTTGTPNLYSMPVLDLQFSATGATLLLAESGFNNLTPSNHKGRVLQYDGTSGAWVRDNTLAQYNTKQKFELGYINGGSGASGGVAFAYDGIDNAGNTIGDYSSLIATGDALTGANCDDFIRGCAYGLNYFDINGGNPNSSVIYDVDNYVYNDINSEQDKGDYGDIDIILGACELTQFDFGDLPDTDVVSSTNNYRTEYHHSGPYHLISNNLMLGNTVDADADAMPTNQVDGDDNDGIDDEDGISFSTTAPKAGEVITINISAINTTGVTGHIEGWFDWNANGDFYDSGEKVVNIDDSAGSFPASLNISIPFNVATNGMIGARFRISNSNNMQPTGYLPIGEVEEYFLSISVETFDIGNYIWLDEDGDGDQDAGEQGIGGVPVYLLNAASAVIDSTITDFNGGYLFSVVQGSYTIEIDDTKLPAGLNQPTYDLDGTLDHKHLIFVFGSGSMDVDFGYNHAPPADTNSPGVVSGAIGNRVWSDDNLNGIQDVGETGIGGVVVYLFDETNALIGNTTTNSAGYYMFDNVNAGVYSVEIDDSTLPIRFNTTPTGDPDGDSDSVSELFVLAPGDVVLIQDFGYNDPSAYDIGNLVYIDSNVDANYTIGEPTVPGVSVALIDDTNSNGIWDIGEIPIATDITDNNGGYLFTGVGSGDYIVAITDTDNTLSNMINSNDPDGGNDGYSAVQIISFNNLVQDFGYIPIGHTTTNGMIGDYVFLDADRNNALSTDDSGIEGVTVNLYDNTSSLVATTLTNSSGLYVFGGLNPDTYTVEIDVNTLPSGLTNSVDPDGGSTDESVVVLTTGEINLDQDFGYQSIQDNTISGTLWRDIDANGTLDESSPLYFPNVTVVLKDANGQVIAEKTTDSAGNFSFDGIPDGTFTVDITDDLEILNGFWKSNGTTPNANNNSQQDTYTVSVSGGSTDETADFGYYIDLASLGNRVWLDNNNNGLQDIGETGMPSTVVNLQINYPGGVVLNTNTMTDSDGYYTFKNLLMDEDYNAGGGGANPIYTLSITSLPTNFLATVGDVNSNGNDLEDSDNHTGVFATPQQGQENVVILPTPNTEIIPASYDFGMQIDCAAPMMHYAVTDGAISGAGQTTDYFYSGNVQDTSGLQLPLHAPQMQQDGVIRCKDFCVDNGWSYYYNPLDQDEYLFAIEHGSNVTEIDYIELRVASNPADRYAVNSTDATFVMARDWYVRTVNDASLVDATGNPTTVNIRFYFPEEEFQEIVDAAINQAVNVWNVNAPTASDVYWFKRADFDPSFHINTTGTLLTPFDMTALQTSATSATGVNTADGIAGSIGNAKNHIQFDGVDGFSGGTAAISINITTLPVELSRFEGVNKDCDVLLFWTAEKEENFDQYIIEKSLDGKNFNVLGMVDSKHGDATKHYEYQDERVKGTFIYRLKMVDLDGTVDYSNAVTVTTDCDNELGDLSVFPNPVSSRENSINVEFESKEATMFVSIVDMLGKQMMEFPIDAAIGNNSLKIDMSNLAAGTYFINLQFNKSQTKTARFVKVVD